MERHRGERHNGKFAAEEGVRTCPARSSMCWNSGNKPAAGVLSWVRGILTASMTGVRSPEFRVPTTPLGKMLLRLPARPEQGTKHFSEMLSSFFAAIPCNDGKRLPLCCSIGY